MKIFHKPGLIVNLLPITLFIFCLLHPRAASSQTTSNTSTVSNSAAPSASSVTTGGTNINYQTNNAYNNELGFGPGIFCRTPTIYLGGNGGQARLNAFDPVQESGNDTRNYAFNMGILYPFGSSALADCKSLVKTIALDRKISSQLSMIKACHDLHKRGITVDSSIYPLLEPCERYSNSLAMQGKRNEIAKDNASPIKGDVKDNFKLSPKTVRAL